MVAHRPDWTHLAPARVGRADRRVLLQRLRGAAARRARSIEHVAADLRRGRGRRRVVRAARPRAPARGHALPRSAAARRSARRPTSSTCGSTPAAATPRCWRRGPSCGGRPSCTSRARTSTAAGSTPRCWRRSATRGAAALPDRAHARLRRGRRGAEDVEVGRQRRHARRAPAEVRRRGPAPVGGRRGLHRGHPALERDPRPARRRLPAASATPSGSCSATSPTSIPTRDRQSVRAPGRGRPLDPRPAGPARSTRVRRAYEEYEFHTVFHSVHNFCAVDLSALYLDIIKDRLYTSRPDDPRGARRRRRATTSSARWRG